MKKTYFTPDMEIFEVKINNSLLAGSDVANEDGEVNPSTTDPNDENWGDDY